MHEVAFAGRPPIDGYGPGVFRVAGRLHHGGLLMLPDRIAAWSPAAPPTPACFAAVTAAADGIDLLLVGAGPDIVALPAEALAALEGSGVAVETMATPAACRTFNVLLAEGRRVAAALRPV